MPSPFPGMDPYLEGRRIWSDVHDSLIIEIRDAEGDELITTIEILSRSNKLPGPRRREYEAKRRQVFESWTSLVEIDLLRAGKLMEMRPSPSSDYRILVLQGWEYPQARLL